MEQVCVMYLTSTRSCRQYVVANGHQTERIFFSKTYKTAAAICGWSVRNELFSIVPRSRYALRTDPFLTHLRYQAETAVKSSQLARRGAGNSFATIQGRMNSYRSYLVSRQLT